MGVVRVCDATMHRTVEQRTSGRLIDRIRFVSAM
jgi:hypothetical protein